MKKPMNPQPTQCKCAAGLAYGVAILGAFLIVAALVWAMRHYTQPAPLNANRAAERAKALAELRASETEALNNAGWIDSGKGIVRLPIAEAMRIVTDRWPDPAVLRSNLTARVEKAMPAPPPPPPAQPSAFE
jgi:hypothetical protein